MILFHTSKDRSTIQSCWNHYSFIRTACKLKFIWHLCHRHCISPKMHLLKVKVVFSFVGKCDLLIAILRILFIISFKRHVLYSTFVNKLKRKKTIVHVLSVFLIAFATLYIRLVWRDGSFNFFKFPTIRLGVGYQVQFFFIFICTETEKRRSIGISSQCCLFLFVFLLPHIY